MLRASEIQLLNLGTRSNEGFSKKRINMFLKTLSCYMISIYEYNQAVINQIPVYLQ